MNMESNKCIPTSQLCIKSHFCYFQRKEKWIALLRGTYRSILWRFPVPLYLSSWNFRAVLLREYNPRELDLCENEKMGVSENFMSTVRGTGPISNIPYPSSIHRKFKFERDVFFFTSTQHQCRIKINNPVSLGNHICRRSQTFSVHYIYFSHYYKYSDWNF